MDLSSGEISTLLFKRLLSDDLGNFSLDPMMLMVLMELDGRTNLGVIAKKAGLNMSSMRDIISRLLQLKLIERVENEIRFLDQDFIDYLSAQFSIAVGPIARVLIEDEVHDLGFDMSKIPAQQVAELVERLTREIRREEKKAVFKRNMINKIRQKGYFNPT